MHKYFFHLNLVCVLQEMGTKFVFYISVPAHFLERAFICFVLLFVCFLSLTDVSLTPLASHRYVIFALFLCIIMCEFCTNHYYFKIYS